MKKSVIVISFLVLMALFASPVSASAETKAGIKPGSFFYFFDLLGEKISLFFTRDPYEKTKKNLLFADERIAEIKASGDNQKAKLKAADEFTKDIARSLESLDNIKEDSQKAGFLISFANREKEYSDTLVSLYTSLPQEEQPIFGEKFDVFVGQVEKAGNEIKIIASKKAETPGANNASSSQIALSGQQQKPPSATQLKEENPKQYKSLVDENKTQLVEASKNLSNKNIIARVKPSVVYIETTDGSGSGIIVGADGYVLTNAHVVEGVNFAVIKLTDGRSFNGIIVGRDENIDLALLKINTTGLSAAFLSNSDLVEQGDPVFTFGYPYGIEGDVSFKEGILSSHRKIGDITYLEISAQIAPGNSGGPLVNQTGEVIGVNTWAQGSAKIAGVLVGETLKYALPINVAKNLIPDLKNGRNVVTPKSSITIPVPSPSSSPSPGPSCTQDIWNCSNWSVCSTSGSQNRSCSIIYDCPTANTPSPSITQSCTPPVPTTISNVKAEEKEYGEVYISWDSNKIIVYSKILLSIDSNLNNAKEYSGSNHVSIYGLVQNTTYYYRVIIPEIGTSEVKSSILNFTTKKTTADVNVDILHISPSSIKIIVKSDLDVYASLYSYKREDGQQSSYCGSLYSSLCLTNSNSYTKSREHIFEFKGLTIGATYFYDISIGGAGTFTKSGTFKATDPNDVTPPSFLNLEALIQSETAVPVIWGDRANIRVKTNELSQFKVEFSAKSDFSEASTVCNNLNDKLFGFGDSINCEIGNLSRGIEYFYRVTTRDPAGNSAVSEIKNFIIPAEEI